MLSVYQNYWDIRLKSSLSEFDRNRYGDFLWPNCCMGRVAGNPRGNTSNTCFWKPLQAPSTSIKSFKTLKYQILESQLSLLSELFCAFENLPVYLGAKCSGRVWVCLRFSSKGLEGIPGIAKQAVLEANRCPASPYARCTGLAGAQGWQIGDSKHWVSHYLTGNPVRRLGGLH